MRDVACKSWVALQARKPFVFLTGDLGFRALEPLRDAMGERFINAGVAEQNMVGVAAGLASQGLDVWVYSIASFCYARPFEQIRNDLCMHGLPVKLVGNGGGYAYGAMGATHHALEDYGALLSLDPMRVFVPAFAEDVDPMVAAMSQASPGSGPAYLRLGRGEKPDALALPGYAAWRRLRQGGGPVVVVVGPLAGGLWAALADAAAIDAELWVLSELPLLADEVPAAFFSAVSRSRRLCVVEEHVAHGGAGSALARLLLSRGIAIEAFEHAAARGYPSGCYGSQAFHRRESGLDVESLMTRIEKLTRRS